MHLYLKDYFSTAGKNPRCFHSLYILINVFILHLIRLNFLFENCNGTKANCAKQSITMCVQLSKLSTKNRHIDVLFGFFQGIYFSPKHYFGKFGNILRYKRHQASNKISKYKQIQQVLK